MRAVLTTDEMRAADAAALQVVSHDALVRRAGTVVAHAALRMLGGAYGPPSAFGRFADSPGNCREAPRRLVPTRRNTCVQQALSRSVTSAVSRILRLSIGTNSSWPRSA